MTSLSTHVLDTAHGRPAAGVRVRLRQEDALLVETWTDADGRCPALKELSLAPGRYRLEFAVGGYFESCSLAPSDPPFLDIVIVDFGVADDGHYHVPLLVSPFGYSTYRGS